MCYTGICKFEDHMGNCTMHNSLHCSTHNFLCSVCHKPVFLHGDIDYKDNCSCYRCPQCGSLMQSDFKYDKKTKRNVCSYCYCDNKLKNFFIKIYEFFKSVMKCY